MQTPSLLPLRVGPDESLQKACGHRPPKLCCVAKVGPLPRWYHHGSEVVLGFAEEVSRHLEYVGKCGELNSGLCVCKAGEVPTPPSPGTGIFFIFFPGTPHPPSPLLFSRKKPTQSLSQHAQLVSPRQPHRTSLLRSEPAQGPGPWPGQVPVTRPVLWLLTPLVSGPTLWPQHHLIPHPAALQSQMPTLLSLLG